MLLTFYRNELIVDRPNMGDEIHVKLGGDHGGGSFKACYEVCNTKHPNSKDSTVMFSIFEAKDSRVNVRTGMDVFKQQVDRLQDLKWK